MRRRLGLIGIMLVALLLGYGYYGDSAVANDNEFPELHAQKIVLDPAVPLEQGKTLTVRLDIVNTGKKDAQGFTIDYAWRPLGSQNGWTTFATEEIASLRILDQVVTRTVTLDSNVLHDGAPGALDAKTTFELRAILDPDNRVAEEDETNNELRTSFSVLSNVTLGKPDLRPMDLNFDPVSPVSVDSQHRNGLNGDTISIASVVENIGDADAQPFDVQISYCAIPISQIAQSCPQALTPLETRLVDDQGSRALGGLAKGGSLAFKADLPFRNGNALLLEAGTYLFQVEVDSVTSDAPSGEIDEQDEANNVLVGFLTVRGPELRPTRIELGTSPVRNGDVVDVIATITNNGSSSVGAGYRVTFFINGIPFGSGDGPAIDPSGTGTVSASLNTAEFNLGEGRAHLIRVEVDSTNVVFEPDENNNALETSLTLLPALPALPELHPKDIVLTPPSPLEKDRDVRLVVNSSIVNTGNAAALGFNIEFSFRPQGAMRWQPIACTIPALGCRDQSLGRGQEVLAQGELPVEQLNAGVTYEVRVVVDQNASPIGFGAVEELDESNNALETTFTVRVSKLPDLLISTLRFIPEDLTRVRPGQQIQVLTEVTNLGELDATQGFDVTCRLVDLLTLTEQPCPGQSRAALEGLALDARRTVGFLIDTTALAPGFYQILVTVDPDDAVRELDEANNIALTSSELDGNALIVQGVDLSVLPVFDSAIPLSVIQGGAVSFRVQVFNEGLENAARFTVRLVVDCPSEGVRVIDKEFLGLGAGDGTIVGFTFGDETDPNDPTFPLPVGVCQLNVIVDPDNVIPENNELNNFLFAEGFGAQLTVEPRLADLLPAEILFDSPLRSTDLPTRISVKVVNQGGRPSGSFLTQLALCLHRTAFVFLSSCESDADFLSADTFQTRQVTNLDPGESRLVNFDFTNLAPGSYVIRASVDASSRQGGEVSESDETNNTLTLIPPLEILPPPANVRPTQLEYPITPIALGLAVPVVAQIVNAGGGFTTDFRVRFSYCRFDPTTNAFCNDPSAFTQFPDTLGSLGQTLDFGVVMVNGIPANTTVRVPTTLLTADLQPGNYVLRVEADIDNVLLESDETDNILVTQAPLLLQGQDQGTNAGDGQSPPSGQSEADLVITNFELDKSLVPEGTRFKFNFTVFNQGVQDAGAFTVKVFYKKIGNQDVKFDSTRIEFLGQKQSLTLESTLNTKGLEPGRYKIIVIVDTFNEIQESFEANNRQERWLRVI